MADQPVCLIGVRVAREEQAKEALGENLLEFTLEKMVSEIVDESVENTSVIKKIVNEAVVLSGDRLETDTGRSTHGKMPYADKNGTGLCGLLLYLLYWNSMQHGTAS